MHSVHFSYFDQFQCIKELKKTSLGWDSFVLEENQFVLLEKENLTKNSEENKVDVWRNIFHPHLKITNMSSMSKKLTSNNITMYMQDRP